MTSLTNCRALYLLHGNLILIVKRVFQYDQHRVKRDSAIHSLYHIFMHYSPCKYNWRSKKYSNYKWASLIFWSPGCTYKWNELTGQHQYAMRPIMMTSALIYVFMLLKTYVNSHSLGCYQLTAGLGSHLTELVWLVVTSLLHVSAALCQNSFDCYRLVTRISGPLPDFIWFIVTGLLHASVALYQNSFDWLLPVTYYRPRRHSARIHSLVFIKCTGRLSSK